MFNIPFQIKFVNICGLGYHAKNKYRLDKIPYKIKELCTSSNYKPTIYLCLETHLKSFHKNIRLPRSLRYLAETSSDSGSGGIYAFSDNIFEIENRASDVKVIESKHALYIKVKIKDEFLNLIIVYLPFSKNEVQSIFLKIDQFIQQKNIQNFCFLGDFNIDFQNPVHRTRANILLSFLNKHRLYNLAEKLNCLPKYTWIGRGKRFKSKSVIDHFFCNFDAFTSISFNHNSFSDHQTVNISTKTKFSYKPPTWRPFLFSQKEFVDLLKEESVNFLNRSADTNSIKQNHETYYNNPMLVDDDFTFNGFEHTNTTVFFNLIEHLKLVHDKFYSKMRQKDFKKTKDFDVQIKMLYNQIENAQNYEYVQKQISELIQTQQDYFKLLVITRSETYYMRTLLLDGKSNSVTFQNFKKKSKHNYKLIVDGETITNAQKVAEIFGENHSNLISPKELPKSDLSGLLDTFKLNLDDMFPKLINVSSPYSNSKEFKDVIKSIKSSSATGPSSEPKLLYKFLFDLFPKFSTKSFNHLYDIEIEMSPFSYIKKRNICFLPKKDLDTTKTENHRGIALAETPYKILSKAMNKKVTPHLSKICDENQNGFIPGRNMTTTSISILSTMNYIRSESIDSQCVSFDMKKAFDSTLYSVSDVIIKHIFPNGNFAKSWISLTNGGSYQAIVNQCKSKLYNISMGFAQGGPSSSSRYIIYNHIFVCCLRSSLFDNIRLKIADNLACPNSLADDVVQFFQFKTMQDVELVSFLLVKLKDTINLQVNFSKTKVLTHGNFPANLSTIGNISPYIKHLGIYLSFDEKLASSMTYNELINKLNSRSKNICFSYGSSVLKRRNVCTSLMNSLCYHIYRVYAPNKKQITEIWKSISKFFWSSKTKEGFSIRFKVAKCKVERYFYEGGLEILLPAQQSFSIWITSFFNILKHACLYPKSTISQVLQFKNVPVKQILQNFGSNIFKEYMEDLQILYPFSCSTYFDKAYKYFKQLEINPNTFLHSSIFTSSWCKSVKFKTRDINYMNDNNLFTISSLLEHKKINQKVLFLPIINHSLNDILIDKPMLFNKINKVLKNITKNFPSLDSFSSSKIKYFSKTLLQISNKQKSIFSYHFKKQYRCKKNKNEHPAFKTRRDSNIYVPDYEMFKLSYQKLLLMPLPLHFKSFFFEQINRTLPSRNKLSNMKIIDSNLCIKCNVKADAEHVLFLCFFPKFFIDSLAKFLDKTFNNSNPDFIFLKENFYLFNIYYEAFTYDEYLQITLLILIAKDRSLKINNDTCLNRWNDWNCFSQSIFISQLTCKILDNLGKSCELINQYLEFLIYYKDDALFFRN